MAVFRVEKTKDYTLMSNYHLRDKNLTLKAKGLLSWMLSNTDDWDYTVAGIVSVMKENRDAINSALCELEDYGYLTRQRVRDNTGKFTDVEYLITEKPITENPLLENPQQINTNINKELKEKNTLSTKEEQAPETKSYRNYGEIYRDSINSEIREPLETFINSLKAKHNYTPKITTVAKFADNLREYSSNNTELAKRIVQQSIDNNWKALYKLKGRHNSDAVSVAFNPDKDTLATDSNGNVIVF